MSDTFKQQLKKRSNNVDQVIYDVLKTSSREFNTRLHLLSKQLDPLDAVINMNRNNVSFIEDLSKVLIGSLSIVSRFRDARTYLSFLSQTSSFNNQDTQYEREEYIKRVDYVLSLIKDFNNRYGSIADLTSYMSALNEMRGFIERSDINKAIHSAEHFHNILMGYNTAESLNTRSISVDEKLTKKFVMLIYKCQLIIVDNFSTMNKITVSEEYEKLTGMVMHKEIANAIHDRDLIVTALRSFNSASDNPSTAERNSSNALMLENAINVIYDNNVGTELRNVCFMLPADITNNINSVDDRMYARDCFSFGNEPDRLNMRTQFSVLKGEPLRKAIDAYEKFFTDYYNSYISLCEAAQALDSLLMSFTKNVRDDTKLFDMISDHLQSAQTFNYSHGNIKKISEAMVNIFDPNGCYLVNSADTNDNIRFGQLRPSIDLLFNRVPSNVNTANIESGLTYIRKYTADVRAERDDSYSAMSKMNSVKEYYQYDTVINSIMMLFGTLVHFTDSQYVEAGRSFSNIRKAIEYYLCKGIYKIDYVLDSSGVLSCIDTARNNAFNLLDTNVRISLTHVNDIDYSAFPLTQTTIHGKGHYLLTHMIKALVSKTMTVLGAFDIQDYTNNKPFRINTFDTARSIMGKAIDNVPTVIPEASELYIRLPLLVEFYKTIFKINPVGSSQVTMGVTVEEPFAGLINIIFVSNAKSSIAEYTQSELYRIIKAVNHIYETYATEAAEAKVPLLRYVVYKMIKAVNKAYGILNRYDYGKMIEYASDYLELKKSKYLDIDIDYDFEEDISNIKFNDLPSNKFTYSVNHPRNETAPVDISESLHLTTNVDILKNFRKRIFAYLLDYEANDVFRKAYDPVSSIFSLTEMMAKLKHNVAAAGTNNEARFREIFKIVSNTGSFTTPDTVRLALIYDMVFNSSSEIEEVVSFMENVKVRFSETIVSNREKHVAVIGDNRFGDNRSSLSRAGSIGDYTSNLFSLALTAVGNDKTIMKSLLSNPSLRGIASMCCEKNEDNLLHLVLYSKFNKTNAEVDEPYKTMFEQFYQPDNFNNLSDGANINKELNNISTNINDVAQRVELYKTMTSISSVCSNNYSWRNAFGNAIKHDFTKTVRKILLHPHLFNITNSNGYFNISFEEARSNCTAALEAISSIVQEMSANSNVDQSLYNAMVKRVTSLRQRVVTLFRKDNESVSKNLTLLLSGRYDDLVTLCMDSIKNVHKKLNNLDITEKQLVELTRAGFVKLNTTFWKEFVPTKNNFTHYTINSALGDDVDNKMFVEARSFKHYHMIVNIGRNNYKLDLNDLVYAEPSTECFNTSGNFAFDLVSYFNYIVSTYLKGVIGSDGKVLSSSIELGLDDCPIINNSINNISKINFMPDKISYGDSYNNRFNILNPKYSCHRDYFDNASNKKALSNYHIDVSTTIADIVPSFANNKVFSSETANVYKPVNSVTRTIELPETFGVYHINNSLFNNSRVSLSTIDESMNIFNNRDLLKKAAYAFDLILNNSPGYLTTKLFDNDFDKNQILKLYKEVIQTTLQDDSNVPNTFNRNELHTIKSTMTVENFGKTMKKLVRRKYPSKEMGPLPPHIDDYYKLCGNDEARITTELSIFSGFSDAIENTTCWCPFDYDPATNGLSRRTMARIQNIRHLLWNSDRANPYIDSGVLDTKPLLVNVYDQVRDNFNFVVNICKEVIATDNGNVYSKSFLEEIGNHPHSFSNVILALAGSLKVISESCSGLNSSQNIITEHNKLNPASAGFAFSSLADFANVGTNAIGCYALPRGIANEDMSFNMKVRNSNFINTNAISTSDSAKQLYSWANHAMVFTSGNKWKSPVTADPDHFAEAMDIMLNSRDYISWCPKQSVDGGVLLKSTANVIRNIKSNTDGAANKSYLIQSVSEMTDKLQCVYNITGSITFANYHLNILQNMLNVASNIELSIGNVYTQEELRTLKMISNYVSNMITRLRGLDNEMAVHRNNKTIRYGNKSYFDNESVDQFNLLATNSANYMLDGSLLPVTIFTRRENTEVFRKKNVERSVLNGTGAPKKGKNNYCFDEHVDLTNDIKFIPYGGKSAAVHKVYNDLFVKSTEEIIRHDPIGTEDIFGDIKPVLATLNKFDKRFKDPNSHQAKFEFGRAPSAQSPSVGSGFVHTGENNANIMNNTNIDNFDNSKNSIGFENTLIAATSARMLLEEKFGANDQRISTLDSFVACIINIYSRIVNSEDTTLLWSMASCYNVFNISSDLTHVITSERFIETGLSVLSSMWKLQIGRFHNCFKDNGNVTIPIHSLTRDFNSLVPSLHTQAMNTPSHKPSSSKTPSLINAVNGELAHSSNNRSFADIPHLDLDHPHPSLLTYTGGYAASDSITRTLKFLRDYLYKFDTELFSEPYMKVYQLAVCLIKSIQPSAYEEHIRDQPSIVAKASVVSILTDYINQSTLSNKIDVDEERLSMVIREVNSTTLACALIGFEETRDRKEQLVLRDIILNSSSVQQPVSLSIQSPTDVKLKSKINEIDRLSSDQIYSYVASKAGAGRQTKREDFHNFIFDVDIGSTVTNPEWFLYLAFNMNTIINSKKYFTPSEFDHKRLLSGSSEQLIATFNVKQGSLVFDDFVSFNHGSVKPVLNHENSQKMYSALSRISEFFSVEVRSKYYEIVPSYHNANDWASSFKSMSNLYASSKCFYDLIAKREGTINFNQFPYLKSLVDSINSGSVVKINPETVLSVCKMFGKLKFSLDEDPFSLTVDLQPIGSTEITPQQATHLADRRSMIYIAKKSDESLSFINTTKVLSDSVTLGSNEAFIRTINEIMTAQVPEMENVQMNSNMLHDKESLMKLSILELGVMPIDVHAMTREIPLAFILNYSTALDDYILENTGGTYISQDVVDSRYEGFTKNNEKNVRSLLGSYITKTGSSVLPEAFEYINIKTKSKLENDIRNQRNLAEPSTGLVSDIFENLKLNSVHKLLNNVYLSTNPTYVERGTVHHNIIARAKVFDAFRPYYGVHNASAGSDDPKNPFSVTFNVPLVKGIKNAMRQTPTDNTSVVEFNLFNDFYPVINGADNNNITVELASNMDDKYYRNALPRFVNNNNSSVHRYTLPLNSVWSVSSTLCGAADSSVTKYDPLLVTNSLSNYFVNKVMNPLKELGFTESGQNIQNMIYDQKISTLGIHQNDQTLKSFPISLGLGHHNFSKNIGLGQESTRNSLQELHVLSKVLYTEQGFSYSFTRNILSSGFWYNAMRHQLTKKFTNNKFDLIISNRHLFSAQK